MKTKICSKKSGCGREKPTSEFDKATHAKDGLQYLCKECSSKRAKERYIRDKEKINKKHREQYAANPEPILAKQKDRYAANKEKKAAYAKANRTKIRIRQRAYDKKKRQNNPAYKLRKNISRAIAGALKKQGSSKQGQSMSQYLPYNEYEVCIHMESMFQGWMTFDNYGTYNKETWDDNDPNTWTWNIDHIVPQALFPYTSMEDENFRKCWSLWNLRPYSAKQNNEEAAAPHRHHPNWVKTVGIWVREENPGFFEQALASIKRRNEERDRLGYNRYGVWIFATDGSLLD